MLHDGAEDLSQEKLNYETSDYDQAADSLPFRKGVTAFRIHKRFHELPWLIWDRPGLPDAEYLKRKWPPFLWDLVDVTAIEQPSLARHAPHVHNILQDPNGFGTRHSCAVRYYRTVLAQTISERIQFLSEPFPGRIQGADAQTWFGDVHDSC